MSSGSSGGVSGCFAVVLSGAASVCVGISRGSVSLPSPVSAAVSVCVSVTAPALFAHAFDGSAHAASIAASRIAAVRIAVIFFI